MNVIQQRVTELVDPRVEIELLADGFVFTEGPVWSFRDSHLTFSDIPADAMYRSDEREGVRAYRKPSNFSNGLAYHADGALIACEHRTRRVTRETPSGVQRSRTRTKGVVSTHRTTSCSVSRLPHDMSREMSHRSTVMVCQRSSN